MAVDGKGNPHQPTSRQEGTPAGLSGRARQSRLRSMSSHCFPFSWRIVVMPQMGRETSVGKLRGLVIHLGLHARLKRLGSVRPLAWWSRSLSRTDLLDACCTIPGSLAQPEAVTNDTGVVVQQDGDILVRKAIRCCIKFLSHCQRR